MNPHRIRAFAPGRVNLIGEHTDYNLGLCLPFAVERMPEAGLWRLFSQPPRPRRVGL